MVSINILVKLHWLGDFSHEIFEINIAWFFNNMLLVKNNFSPELLIVLIFN